MMKLDRDVLFLTRDYFYNSSYLYDNPILREKLMSYNIVLYKFEKILKIWYNYYVVCLFGVRFCAISFLFNVEEKNDVYNRQRYTERWLSPGLDGKERAGGPSEQVPRRIR